MKTTSLIITLFVILSFISCNDGQERMHKTPQEVLHENKLLDSFSENIIYTPVNYNEVENDTLFASGHRILIKYYTDLENSILVSNKEESKNHKHYYREFSASVLVTKGDNVYFDKTIDKDFLINSEISTRHYLQDKYMKNIWIQNSDSNFKDKLIINIEFFSPLTNESIIYKIIISKNVYLILENNLKD